MVVAVSSSGSKSSRSARNSRSGLLTAIVIIVVFVVIVGSDKRTGQCLDNNHKTSNKILGKRQGKNNTETGKFFLLTMNNFHDTVLAS